MQKRLSVCCDRHRATSLMPFDKSQESQVFPFRFRRGEIQIIRANILTPAKQAQNINIPHAENQSAAPLFTFLQTPKALLRRCRRKNNFGVFLFRYVGPLLCPHIVVRQVCIFSLPHKLKNAGISMSMCRLTPIRQSALSLSRESGKNQFLSYGYFCNFSARLGYPHHCPE